MLASKKPWKPRPGLAASLALRVSLCLCACAEPAAAPGFGALSAPIYHGERDTETPWGVSVYYPKPESTSLRLCTGSVIGPRAVLRQRSA